MVVGHGAVLTGLNPGTKYYFVCQSTGANGSTGYSTVFSFTTTGTPAVAPVISNITVTNITTASATINWTTDQAATSVVNYGTTPSYGLSATGAASTTSHSVTLTGLTPGTLYDFDVMSANAAGTTAISANGTLTTSAAVANPPLISGINTTNLTNTSVTVNWTTDQASTSVVNYGTTTGYGLSSSTPAASTTHSVTLTGLTPGTTYNFVVVSALSSGPSAISGNNVFTTPALSGNSPMLSYLAFYGVTASGVTISWSTNVPSTTVLVYGTTASFGQVTPVQTTLSTTHGVTLTGLLPGTAYYFQAQSADSSGNLGISTTYSFTTQGSLGQVITNVVATPGPGPTGTISFNTSVPAYSYVQYGTSAGSYGRYSNRTALTTSPVCTLPYVPSGPVHFQIVSQDVSGNTTTSPDMTFLQP